MGDSRGLREVKGPRRWALAGGAIVTTVVVVMAMVVPVMLPPVVVVVTAHKGRPEEGEKAGGQRQR